MRIQVITTFGPRKPQRQSSNANSSITSDLVDASRAQSPTVSVTGGGPPNIVTPCTAKKICLETSFTSLQSPSCDQPQPQPPCSSITPTAMLGTTSSKASSVADSLFGRSQLSSILQYDVSSMGDGPLSDTPTVIHNTDGRSTGRSVAFTDDLVSPHLPTRSILHRNGLNGSAKTHQIRKPTSLAVNGKRAHSDVDRKIDLVYDDWYGMAPLASPETLSEISSISSRASLVNTFTSSIEKYLQRVTFYPPATSGDRFQLKDDDSDSDPDVTVMAEHTQLHTPVIMRRTPKIAGNLSSCADDWRSVDTYKRMGKVFITPARRTPSKSDSSEQSFESANSYKHDRNVAQQKCGGDQGSKSADNLDEPDSGEILNASKLTWSDSAILAESCSSRCPNCPCRIRSSVDCCQQLDHSFCRRVTTTSNGHARQAFASGSSDATFHSAQSSSSQFGSRSSPRRCFRQDIADGVLESHFPVYHSPHTIPSMLPQSINETASLLDDIVSKHASSASSSPRTKPPRRKDLVASATGRAAATASSTNRWTDDDDDDNQRCFSRNESLPLLSKKLAASLTARGLSSKRNRKQVYPILSSYSRNASPVHRQTISSSSSSVASTKGGESSV